MTSLLSFLFSSAFVLTSCASGPVNSAPGGGSEKSGAVSKVVPSATAISLEESQKVEFPLTADDKKKLPREFKKALAEEERAFDHQEKAATKEFSAAQSSKVKTWNAREKQERHDYFKSTTKGPERRKYIQDYIERKKSFDQSIKDEAISFRAAWKQKKDFLKQSQKEREVQFKSVLDQNKRPPASLWPQAH